MAESGEPRKRSPLPSGRCSAPYPSSPRAERERSRPNPPSGQGWPFRGRVSAPQTSEGAPRKSPKAQCWEGEVLSLPRLRQSPPRTLSRSPQSVRGTAPPSEGTEPPGRSPRAGRRPHPGPAQRQTSPAPPRLGHSPHGNVPPRAELSPKESLSQAEVEARSETNPRAEVMHPRKPPPHRP